jgi:hypothetical protein
MINDRATHLSYMIVHESGCLLYVALLAGFKDGSMLPLGPGRVT